MLRFGPEGEAIVVVAPALFEEANRTRAFTVAILRALAARGVASALPDLPGTGESSVETKDASLTGWRRAFAAATASAGAGYGRVHLAALRGGALVVNDARGDSLWCLSPLAGSSLVRDLLRTRAAAARETGERFDLAMIAQPGPPVELAGNCIGRELLSHLQGAEPAVHARHRTVRLTTDAETADARFAGAPLWRRSEPGSDPALAEALAGDIAGWIAACAA